MHFTWLLHQSLRPWLRTQMISSPLGNSMSNSVPHILTEANLQKYSNSNGRIMFDEINNVHIPKTLNTLPTRTHIQPCSFGGYIYIYSYSMLLHMQRKPLTVNACNEMLYLSTCTYLVKVQICTQLQKMDKNFGPTNDGMTRQKWISF